MKQFLLLAICFLWISIATFAAQPVDPSLPFQRLFRVPAIDYSIEQEAQVDAIRQEMLPKLLELQKQLNRLFTSEQLAQRNAAIRKSQHPNQKTIDCFRAFDGASPLTNDQRQVRSELGKARNALLTDLRQRVLVLLTDDQRQIWASTPRVQKRVPPTHPDLVYGPHGRNVMDLWLAESDRPTPVLVAIHGGGFLGGDKSVSTDLLRECLKAGISVAAITYRFSTDAIAPAPFRDSARAIQFLRHHAQEWNLDGERIAATGDSAGAGISMWLGFHDDLADPDQDDPILWESSRLTCLFVTAGQSSYDPRLIRELIPEVETYRHPALAQLFDIDLDQLDNLPADKYRLMDEVSPITHVSPDDAAAMLFYIYSVDEAVSSLRIGIHHARFGALLKSKMDANGVRCEVYAGDQVLGGGTKITPLQFLKQEFAKPLTR